MTMRRRLAEPPCSSVRQARPTGVRASGLAIVGLLLVLGACHRTPAVPADVAVSIDGELIPYSDFEGYVQPSVGDLDVDLDGATYSSLFDQFLDEQLLVRLATERGLVEADIDQRQAVAFLLRSSQPRVSERQIEAYYQANRRRFTRPATVKLRQILVPERGEADAALAAIDAGEEFRLVAAWVSQGPTAHLGGGQGWLARGDLPSKYAELIFRLQPGDVSGVIEADYGFQIFQVVSKQDAGLLPLDEVADEIRGALSRQQQDETIAQILADAHERYNVDVFPANFPFEYRGQYSEYDPGHSGK